MDWLNQIGGLLQQYGGGQSRDTAEDDFDQVARHAPQEDIAEGMAESFRSDQTPPFPNMLGQMFGNAGGAQKANILNGLLASLGPAVLGGMMSRGGGGGLAGMLGGAGAGAGLGSLLSGLGGGQTQIAPEQAEQIPPQAVEELARRAQEQDPSVVDRVSHMYAQNPQLFKTVGAAALTVALAHLGKKHKLL